MLLRDLALAWVTANCPSSELQHDFVQRLDEALLRSVGCSFIIGRKLTKAGKPYLVHCFCGELFAFQLTPRQAARLKVTDAMLVSASGLTRHNHEPHPDPPVRLGQVEVDNAESLDRSVPTKGLLKYRADQWWMMPLAIRAACEPAGRASKALYHHLDGVPRGEGSVRFLLAPIGDLRDRQGQPFGGVLPLFFQLCIVGEPEKTSPATPFGPSTHLGHLLPRAPQPPMHAPPLPQMLGEPFIPPSPMPTLMSAETMSFPSHADAWPPVTQASPAPPRFRAISDIRAVLVQVD